MAAATLLPVHDTRPTRTVERPALRDPDWFRALLIGSCAAFLLAVLVLPLCAVLYEAFRRGVGPAFTPWAEEGTLAAARLTLQTAAWVVPLNAVFGIAAGYALGKFR